MRVTLPCLALCSVLIGSVGCKPRTFNENKGSVKDVSSNIANGFAGSLVAGAQTFLYWYNPTAKTVHRGVCQKGKPAAREFCKESIHAPGIAEEKFLDRYTRAIEKVNQAITRKTDSELSQQGIESENLLVKLRDRLKESIALVEQSLNPETGDKSLSDTQKNFLQSNLEKDKKKLADIDAQLAKRKEIESAASNKIEQRKSDATFVFNLLKNDEMTADFLSGAKEPVEYSSSEPFHEFIAYFDAVFTSEAAELMAKRDAERAKAEAEQVRKRAEAEAHQSLYYRYGAICELRQTKTGLFTHSGQDFSKQLLSAWHPEQHRGAGADWVYNTCKGYARTNDGVGVMGTAMHVRGLSGEYYEWCSTLPADKIREFKFSVPVSKCPF